MRGVFFILLFANLAFFAWARLIDRPAEPPLNSTISRLPRLQLLSEAQGGGGQGAAAPSATPSGAAPAPERGESGAPGAGGVTSGAGPGAAVPPVARTAPPVAGTAPPVAAAAARCITVGPFADEVHADQASALLKSRGFVPRMRTQPGASVNRYWVFISGFRAPADEAQALQVLQRNGITDAQPMTEAAGRMISVGLFAERAGAERRAAAVRDLGMKAAISQRKEPRPENWVDVDLSSSIQSLPTEGLLSLEDTGERLEIKECPHQPA